MVATYVNNTLQLYLAMNNIFIHSFIHWLFSYMRREDSGMFQCSGSNEAGHVTGYTWLRVKSKHYTACPRSLVNFWIATQYIKWTILFLVGLERFFGNLAQSWKQVLVAYPDPDIILVGSGSFFSDMSDWIRIK